jgi:hypothetical protein
MDVCDSIDELIPSDYLFNNDYSKALKDRWDNPKKRKNSKIQDSNKRSTKKQKINDKEHNDITTKTTINNKQKIDIFNSKDSKTDEPIVYISLDQRFNNIMNRDNYRKSVNFKCNPLNNNTTKDDITDKFSNDMLLLFNCKPIDSSQSNSEPNSELSQNNTNLDENGTKQLIDELPCPPVSDHSNTSECFLCTCGNASHDEIYAKDLDELKDIYVKNRAFCKDDDLAKMMNMYYMEYIYNGRNDLPILTEEMALAHIKNKGYSHTLNSQEHVISSIRSWKKIFDCLVDVLFNIDGQLDKKHFDALEKSQKILDVLYQKDVRKLNFNDPDTNVICKGPVFQRTIMDSNTEKILQNNIKTKEKLAQQHGGYHY